MLNTYNSNESQPCDIMWFFLLYIHEGNTLIKKLIAVKYDWAMILVEISVLILSCCCTVAISDIKRGTKHGCLYNR